MVEQLRPGASARAARVCIFDFDGTISLIRSGWMDVMVPMMVEILAATNSGESEAQLRGIVEDFVWTLTGEQTIYQMIRLGEEVTKRGGAPLAPLEYKRMYLEGLQERIAGRLQKLRDGAPADDFLVPGARALIEALQDRGLKLYLASGTDQDYMREEARLLDVARYFDGGVYGALDDYKSFSKRILIARLIESSECAGGELLGFGDGYVEIENVKEVGGVAVGVATDEPRCLEVDGWKRQRLAGAGADYIIPNYLARKQLLDCLFGS
jgi:phosphoglycolate phosphatase-like HAD superfamily hydrolase